MPKKHAIIRYIVPILIIIISILFFIILKNTRPAPVQVDAEERAWSVQAISVRKTSHRPVLQFYGQITTLNDIQLTATVDAEIIKRHVNLGDTVTPGQLLLSLDRSRLQQTLLQRQAELKEIQSQIDNEKLQLATDKTLLVHEKALLKLANNGVKRAKTLEKSLMASSSQLDDAKRLQLQQKLSINRLEASIANHPARLSQLMAKYQQVQSRLALAEDDLKQTRITSPVNGIITQINIDTAEFVRKGAPLFSVSDTEHLEIQSLLPQTLHAQLKQSMAHSSVINATIKTANGDQYAAVLNRLPSNVNKGQAGSHAFFRFAENIPSVLIGETVTVYAELEAQADSVAIPHDAIYGTDTVFLIKDQRLRRVPIKWLGETFLGNQKMILVRSENIANNDQLLVSKFANAMHGLKVNITNDESNRHAQ